MLDINIEYRRGVLFVRLGGMLNKKTYRKINTNLRNIVSQGGIRYLVFNLKDLIDIDDQGIMSLLDNYDVISNNKGKVMICNDNNNLTSKKIYQSNLFDYCYEISDELTAFNLINI